MSTKLSKVLPVPSTREVLEEPTEFTVTIKYPAVNAEGARQDNILGARVYIFSNQTGKWKLAGDIQFPNTQGVITVDETGIYAVRYTILTKSTVDPDGNAQCYRESDPSPPVTFNCYTVPSATPTEPVVFGACPGCRDDLPAPPQVAAGS